MKRKSLLALGMVVAMTATMMAGCGSSSSDSSTAASDSTEAADTADTSADAAAEESKGGDYKIAVVPKMTNIGWFQRMEEGVNDYNKENGTDYVYRGSAEGADQAGIVEQMLAEDWDAICVVPFDSESLAPVLEKAREQGIVVITHEASSMDPKYFDYDVSHNEWCDAADEYFKANTNMTKLGRYETGDDTTSSYNQTKELLQANPDITAIEGSASTDVVGAAQAVDELGLTGKVAVVGTSMTSIARNYVEKDVINTFSVWDPAKAGQAMIELAINVLDNGEAPDALNVEGYESLTADGTVLYGNARVDVTKDNMDEYDF